MITPSFLIFSFHYVSFNSWEEGVIDLIYGVHKKGALHMLSTFLVQRLTCIFTLSSILLVNSGTLYLNMYFQLTTT